jgi:hypothetical protein
VKKNINFEPEQIAGIERFIAKMQAKNITLNFSDAVRALVATGLDTEFNERKQLKIPVGK